jgi:hypothetical protein
MFQRIFRRFSCRCVDLYFDPWAELPVARELERKGVVRLVQVSMSERSYLSLRDRLDAINATRARYGFGPLFGPKLVERFEARLAS